MSALTGQLSEDSLRELARIVRGIHTRAAAKRERLRSGTQDEAASQDAAPGGEHGA